MEPETPASTRSPARRIPATRVATVAHAVPLVRRARTGSRRVARRATRLLAVALLGASLYGAASGDEGFEPRFAPADRTIELADTVLSPLERQFVDTHPELRVAVQRASFPPYWRVSPDGEIDGYAIDLLQTLASTVGFRLVPIVYDTWPEVLDALRERRADVTPLASYSAERDVYLDYTPGAFPDPIGLMGRAGETRFDDSDDLAGVRVAVGRGFIAERQLKLLYPKAEAVPLDGMASALESLANGSADLVLGSIVPTVTLAEEREDLSLRVMRRVYYGTGWNHIVSRSDWPIVGQLFGRFVGSGRTELVRGFSDTLGTLESDALVPLSLTGAEAARLARYETLRLGALTALPVLNGVTENGTHIGIASGFSAYLSYQFGLPTEVVPYEDTAAMLAGAEAGEIDLIPLLAPSPGQRERFTLSTPYLDTPWLVVGRANERPGSDLGRFAGGRVGMRRDHPLKGLVEREHPDITIVDYATPRALLQDLVRRDIDAGLMSRLVALPLIEQSFSGELHSLGAFDAPPATFSFAAPPATAELIPLIDRALGEMDPALAERITRRWAAVDFEPEAALRRWLRLLVPTAFALAALALAVLWWNRRIAAENRRRVVAEQRLIDMTEGIRTGVFQLRQEGGGTPRFVFSNTLAKELARLPPGDAGFDSHLPFFAHIHPDERRRVGERMEVCLRTGEPFRETFRFEFPGGEPGWMLAEASARTEPDGARFWNGHLFDLTSERRLSEELAALLVAKEEFVASAGHELRAPVQNISLALEALDASRLDPAHRERLATAAQCVDDLRELVDDLLDIARLDARELALRETPTHLPELFESVGRTLVEAIRRKGLTFECRLDPSLPEHALTDPVRVRQILHNLVGNAVKYTDRGGIVLEVFAGDRDAPDGRGDEGAAPERADGTRDVVIEVRDSGIGIPAERLATIFEPFSAVGPVGRRGTGLGLAICRRLATLMNGNIRVESEPGRGTTFRVLLPLRTGEARVGSSVDGAGTRAAPTVEGSRGATVPAADGRDAAGTGRAGAAIGRVLLVDDDAHVRETLAALLRHRGFEVDEAGDAAEALGRLDERPCAALVTDLRMPGMNGVELARAVRRRGGAPALVGMTGGLTGEDAAHAREVFDTVLIKPVSATEVSDALGRSVRAAPPSEEAVLP